MSSSQPSNPDSTMPPPSIPRSPPHHLTASSLSPLSSPCTISGRHRQQQPQENQPRPHPITLIVATTPVSAPTSTATTTTTTTTTTLGTRLGIGLNNNLPWPRIKTDMSFFARVTSRPPHPGSTNAIIMGRKTYEALPKMLRPLRERLNVVISRDTSGTVQSLLVEELAFRRQKATVATTTVRVKREQQEVEKEERETKKKEAGQEEKDSQKRSAVDEEKVIQEPLTDVLMVSSLENALKTLYAQSTSSPYSLSDCAYSDSSDLHGDHYHHHQQNQQQKLRLRRGQEEKSLPEVGNIFVIGGGEIYASALQLPADGEFGRDLRIVMTKVKKRPIIAEGDILSSQPEFECDTFFPINNFTPQSGWREVSSTELSEWVGEPVSSEWREEGNVLIKVVGYQRIV